MKIWLLNALITFVYCQQQQTGSIYDPQQAHRHSHVPISHHPQWPQPSINQPGILPYTPQLQKVALHPQQAPPQKQFPHQHAHHPQVHSHPHPQYRNHLPKSIPKGAIPIPIPSALNPTQFSNRIGGLEKLNPFNPLIKTAKQYLPSNRGRNSKSKRGNRRKSNMSPLRFSEMNRLPKPPQYPLYDMPEMGMATPPPPPLMHPMVGTASELISSLSYHPKRGGRVPPRGKKGHGRRGPPHPPPKHHSPQHGGGGRRHGPGKNRHPPSHHHGRKHGNRPNPPSPYESIGMESQSNSHLSSPPLGRPLSYDEYMQRPSHSFTDDPWNFDPYAQNYNSGMNTFAMKYNYDPLGMNGLDKSQSHLDPQQLSYPGDIYNMDDKGISVGKLTQVGGWDNSPGQYSPHNNNLGQKDSSINIGIDIQGARRSEDPTITNDQYTDPLAGGSHTTNAVVDPIKILAASNPGYGFTLDTSMFNSNNKEMGGRNDWKSYPQQNAYDVYGGPIPDSQGGFSHSINNYHKTPEGRAALQQLKSSSKYENGKYDQSTQLYTYGLSQEYKQARENPRPISDFTDTYNPYGNAPGSTQDLPTSLTPPNETEQMFKRQGHRPSRAEKTPMVELEGLKLFQDILSNQNASNARNHLIRVLTSN